MRALGCRTHNNIEVQRLLREYVARMGEAGQVAALLYALADERLGVVFTGLGFLL